MTLTITSTTTIETVKEQFAHYFPFLKIEFFTKPHNKGEASWSKFMIYDHTTLLGDIENFKHAEVFHFSPEMTVGDFEQALWNECGLSVQVFRRSMNAWIESTGSDAWTLAFQNQKGEEASHSVAEMIYVTRDNDE